jgi:hypothetical protein
MRIIERSRSRPVVSSLVVLFCSVMIPNFVAAEDAPAPGVSERATAEPVTIEHYVPHDSRSLNQFETPKEEGVAYSGFQLNWGGAFTQQFQALHHSNAAAANVVAGVNQNQLIRIGAGMDNAMANLFLNAQLARGIRVEMTNYLSTRHHNETWVKDGFLLIDGSPWANPTLDGIMKYTTLRVGHFEVNYGDAHFRSSDAGNTMANPLVGNLIMNAFTTEIGAEAYVRSPGGLLAMAGITGGEIRGTVEAPQNRAPSYLAKVGFDHAWDSHTRARLTGSLYTTAKSQNNTLYSGSRAGSPYFDVLGNTTSTVSAQAWSGDVQPGFSSKLTAVVVNPFVKLSHLELFGNFEQAKGRKASETTDRKWTQTAGEGLYRFCHDSFYVAGRYDIAKGRMAGMTSDVTVDRLQLGGGLFLTSNVMMKAEYVHQQHKDYPVTDILSGAEFEGAVVAAVVSF